MGLPGEGTGLRDTVAWVVLLVALAVAVAVLVAGLIWSSRPVPPDPPGLFRHKDGDVARFRTFVEAAGNCETEEGREVALVALHRLLLAE